MGSIPATSLPAAAGLADPLRVMVVDDSAVIRGLLARTLDADPDIKVVASVGNGQIALNTIAREDIDVVILDIEMPVMDGLTALPQLIKAAPTVKIIMASTLTRRNAEVSLKALSAGASDYIPKPTSTREIGQADDFKRELVGKVKALGSAKRAAEGPRRPRPAGERVRAPLPAKPAVPDAPVVLRKEKIVPPRVLAIGSSTGGPQALFKVLGAIDRSVTLPILITQHMPPTFTTILAEHIATISKRPCAEAVDKEPVKEGHIYVAPGNFHMTVEPSATGTIIRLNQNPPENFCRPAVDPMLRSIAKVYGPNVLTVILTGMGNDGFKGSQVITASGGAVIAQDEATSVVWGMPRAVAVGGLCSAVLPVMEIAGFISGVVSGRRT
ncbi:MAG TPA: chemotaxis response regulator protein-glutamate methylesterase [Alphaproteobacteria bacterium]|jgi:two-component system chemotaxis response regulator CheB|nr:chemotaxis response regulator protein-glutamate methylesterase [Alphaproteobacteria bacterium]